MKEQVALLNFRNAHLNQHTRDLDEVEKQAAWLKRVIEQFRPMNKMLRDDSGLPPGAPVPKPPDRSDK